jgi:hypothetical protein
MLAIGIPATGSGETNNNTTLGSVNDLVGNVTEDISSSLVNDAETSNLDAAKIMINEVELNPQDNDVRLEWIELYNPAAINVNLSDFEIRTSFKSATIQLPSEAGIAANETYVVELGKQILSNTAESLALVNASGKIIDTTPSLVDRSDDGRTWQRIPDGNNEWQFMAGTRDELNDPGEQANTPHDASSNSAVWCHGAAGCAEGMAIRIVDGDTLYVRVNTTFYKVELALVSAPSRTETGFFDSTSFTRSLCLGSNVLVDQDDNLLTSDTSVIAVVYCESANLNSALLDNDYARLNVVQCQTSEFAIQPWAREHGC